MFDLILNKNRPIILSITSTKTSLIISSIRTLYKPPTQEICTVIIVSMRYMPQMQYILRLLAIWPPKYEDKTFIARQYLYICLCIYNVVGITVYPLATVKDRKIPVEFKLDNLLKIICIIIFTYNFICTFYLREKLVSIYKELEDFGVFGKPPKAEKLSKLMDVITIVLFLYCTIVGICYASFPLINIRSCIHYKKINNSTILCGFATNMKFPYDIDVGWLYYLHLFIQFYCGTTVTAKGVLFFGIVVGTQELIILQFSHLISKLKNVYCDNDFFNQKERLRHCIMYHIRIINLSDELNNSIALLTMPCLVTYNIIIGTSLLVVLNVPTPFSFMNTVGWIVSLFIGCISGERIIRASTAVGGVAYDLKWYADVRLRKDLQLMILRSQKPVRLQCGELGELSFIAFKKIMQGAYTLATMKSGIGR